MDKTFSDAVDEIIERDPRYAKGAYYFVRMGLDHTVKKVATEQKKSVSENDKPNHVSGQQLLDGIREFALEQYGPMAYTLFTQWGLRGSEGFGDIVFNLVEAKILGKTESDKPEDFHAGFNFKSALVDPYRPRIRQRITPAKPLKKKKKRS
ncbi:MAG: hypothetical protein LBV12_03950 [Puniceicoccales bacterium]|jgi:uncharacterized repeat protein (TIGR04138 family)|nr:hypothetical protein [Puniceicoccales bacterium]